MKHLKLVKGYKEKHLECVIVQVERVPTREQSRLPPEDYDSTFEGRDPGYYFELHPPCKGVRRIQLPQDGDSLYIMSESRGRTIDAYHWPDRPKKDETNNSPEHKVGLT